MNSFFKDVIELFGFIFLAMIFVFFIMWFFPMGSSTLKDAQISSDKICYVSKSWHSFDAKNICYQLGGEIK